MKRTILIILTLSLSFLLAFCSVSDSAMEMAAPRGKDGGEHFAGDTGDGDTGGQNKPAAGQLTAGEWSDIKNYDFYLNLFNFINDPENEESQRQNSYYEYINYFGFETRYMLTVNVTDSKGAVRDAEIELFDENKDNLFSAKTDARGNAYLFPAYDLNGENITVKAKSGGIESEQSFVYLNQPVQISLSSSQQAQQVFDLMFVIDTTGSMGDELNYLKSEIADVISSVKTVNPNYTINLALLFYRDIGDEYVTRSFGFTTDIAAQQKNLSKQSSNGGGDFPEAVDLALSEAVSNKNWTSGSATRLIFHVCDAPPHNEQINQTRFYNSVRTAAQKGIRIIPIASSGIDLATEFLLRQEALMTGGTYIFLTDDSGIGNEHFEPTVGEFTVEYLNACVVRVVNEYLSGIETEPISYK